MENERNIESQHEAGSSDSIQEHKTDLDAYREAVEQLSNILRKATLGELVKNPEKLNDYEQIIIDVRDNVERLGRSPPENFKKSQVIQNLENAQEDLAQVQYFLTFKDSNPQVSAESVKHIHPCRRHLDLAASLMVPKEKRT